MVSSVSIFPLHFRVQLVKELSRAGVAPGLRPAGEDVLRLAHGGDRLRVGSGGAHVKGKSALHDALAEIKDYIGLPQAEYRVASVALYPAVPLYNGFYCIDGYSPNYDIGYKHRFREIIATELEKNDQIRTYFDGWGNRCYLFSSELGRSYYFLKNNTRTLKDLQLNHDALVDLGCDYIFSGLEIENCADSGLTFLNTFENDNSPYKIWLYKVA